MKEYACLDCSFETNDATAMDSHIDKRHNESYGQSTPGRHRTTKSRSEMSGYADPLKVIAIRVYEEDGTWAIDGIDDGGLFTESCWQFGTREEAVATIDEFKGAAGISTRRLILSPSQGSPDSGVTSSLPAAKSRSDMLPGAAIAIGWENDIPEPRVTADTGALHEFAFDVKLFAVVRAKAETAQAAARMVRSHCDIFVVVPKPDVRVQTTDTMVEDLVLVEMDGEDVGLGNTP